MEITIYLNLAIMYSSLILVLLVLIISFLATFILINLTRKYNVIDIPNDRSSHELPTPRGGGLAIVITWFSSITYLWIINYLTSNLYFALISGLFLAIVSILDDLMNIKPLIRFLIQLLTATSAIFFLKGFNLLIGVDYNNFLWLAFNFIIIISIVWFINLFNFLDGIDGYASIEAISVALILYFFTSNLLLLIISASTIGFLIWNWPRAKIFMGDVGSTQLGFILVVLGIHFHNTEQFPIWFWLMITSVFWFDATLTLFRRWRNKEKLSQAHRKHAYQRIVQTGFSHLKTDMYLIVINICLFLFIIVINKFNKLFLLLFIINILSLFLLVKRIDRKYPFK